MKLLLVVLTSTLMLTGADYIDQNQSQRQVASVVSGVNSLSNSVQKSRWQGYLTSALTGLNTGINNYLSSAQFQELQRSATKRPSYSLPTLSFPSLNFDQMPKVEPSSFVKKLQDALFQRAVSQQSLPRPVKYSPPQRQPSPAYENPSPITNTYKGTYLKQGSIIPSRGIRVQLPPIQLQSAEPFSTSIRQAPVSQTQIHKSLSNSGSIVKAQRLNLNFDSDYNAPSSYSAPAPTPAFGSQIIEAYRPPAPAVQQFEISNAINIIEDRRPYAQQLQTPSGSEEVSVQVSPNYGSPGLLGIEQDYSLPSGQAPGPSGNSYAAPASTDSSYGAPASPASPGSSYGAPAAPGSSYGAPSSPGSSYGAPASPGSGGQGYQNNRGGSSGGIREIFVHAPAPPQVNSPPRVSQSPVEPEIHQQIIFVKAPAPSSGQTYVELPKQPETKTQVYVLVKQNEEHEDSIRVTKPAPTTPSPPEVFFVRYANNNGQNGGSNSNGAVTGGGYSSR